MRLKFAAELKYRVDSALGTLSALLSATFLATLSIFFILWPITIWFLSRMVIKDQYYLVFAF
jgi:hypothetical protein